MENIKILSLFFLLLIIAGWCFSIEAKSINNEILAGQIAQSLKQMPGPHYRTIAISRIKKRSNISININELIDYTEVKIVRSRRFRVTDRRSDKLQKILGEQRIQLSEFVSADQYKQLGNILGVQLFIYGTVYRDSLVLKAIDVETSVIAWADVFPLTGQTSEHELLYNLAIKLIQSLKKDLSQLRKEKIRKISFWNIDTINVIFSAEQIIDYLTVAICKDQNFSIIDRENLKLIFQEQKLNQENFIDQSEARKMGELYGVDSFLYGSVKKSEESYLSSLKMMSAYNGEIIWGDLIKFERPVIEEKKQVLINPFDKKLKKRRKKRGYPKDMVLIPGGSFIMGSNDPLYTSSPERRVKLRSFYLDKYEVTNFQYLAFVQKKNHRLPISWKTGIFDSSLKDSPIVGISWQDAKLYCQFVKKRLPTESEWERAIRGSKGRKYPWKGPTLSSSFVITKESNQRRPSPVTLQNRDITPEGAYHLAGNVREFVADIYRPYPGSSITEDFPNNERVVRGSSWAFTFYEAVGYYRGHTNWKLAWPDVGFRCAKDL